MGEQEQAEEGDYSAGCGFSLMCQEDGADLDAALPDGVGAGSHLLLLYSSDKDEEEEEEEYMDHLVSKEATASSFCCSPSSTPASSDADSPMASSEEWFRCARPSTVKWILERSVMPWAARLLALACVSLAAKMEEYRAPALSEIRFRADDEGGYDFSCASIRRMELLVLSTLGWRMGDVTPLDYLPCLSSRLRRGHGGGGGGGLVAAKAAALVFAAAEASSVLDYRPSTVAAAAVLAAAHGALTKEALESKMSSLCLSPSKEDVYGCYSLMLSDDRSAPVTTTTRSTSKRKSAKRPSPCSSGLIGAYVSVDDAASGFDSKRMRLEPPPPGIGR